MNGREEQANGVERFGVGSMAALRSLAAGLRGMCGSATVIDHAERGTLREVVEIRDYGAQRKIEERNTARIAHMLPAAAARHLAGARPLAAGARSLTGSRRRAGCCDRGARQSGRRRGFVGPAPALSSPG